MKRLCTLCARGGSKGVKNKNLREICGKPLIVHTIEQARASGLFDLLAVSSDSDEILAIARAAGVDEIVERPAEMATDTAAKIPAIRHCVQTVEARRGVCFDTLVDLDATAPLRVPEDIVGAVQLLESRNVSNVITAALARRSPYFNLVEVDAAGVVRLSKPLPAAIVRRQDAPAAYDMNASIYVWQHDALFSEPPIFRDDTALFVMPEERSIDIDSPLDFRFVEYVMQERKQ